MATIFQLKVFIFRVIFASQFMGTTYIEQIIDIIYIKVTMCLHKLTNYTIEYIYTDEHSENS